MAKNRESKNNQESPGGSRSRRRPSRRARSHAEAAAQENQKPLAKIPDHPLISAEDHRVVSRPDELRRLVDELHERGTFAFDTEFIGEETYVAHMCLIQVGTEDMIALVDPLADLDVTPIWELVADPEVRTLVHAGEQDFEPVVRLLGRPAANIIDTQIAAGFAHRPYPLSLRHLVEECCGVALGKSVTFTRWDRRPLSKQHQRYAADDVRYLPAILDILEPALGESGHMDWCLEECTRRAAITNFTFDPDARLERMVGRRRFSARQRARARALLVFREEYAQQIDRPPRSILKDDVLMRVAKEPPNSVDKLANIRGFPKPLAADCGQHMLDTFAEIASINDGDLPESPRREETPDQKLRIDGLWSMISTWAYGQGVDPGLLGTRTMAADLFWHVTDPQDGDADLDQILPGWRRRFLGPVLDSIDGNGDGKGLHLSWDGRRIAASNG